MKTSYGKRQRDKHVASKWAKKHNLPFDNDQLPDHVDGYPIVYLTQENSVLCHQCATKSLVDTIESFRPISYVIHYEGEPINCDDCSVAIESAYS